MKKLITLFMLISSVSVAQECGKTMSTSQETVGSMDVMTEVPSGLKGATITITKADGSTETVSAEKFMLVKRKHKRPILTVKTKSTTLMCKSTKSNPENILSLEALVGQSGLEKNIISPSQVEVKTKSGLGVGLMYQRNVYKDLYLGGKVDSNENVGLSVGLGF